MKPHTVVALAAALPIGHLDVVDKARDVEDAEDEDMDIRGLCSLGRLVYPFLLVVNHPTWPMNLSLTLCTTIRDLSDSGLPFKWFPFIYEGKCLISLRFNPDIRGVKINGLLDEGALYPGGVEGIFWKYIRAL